MHDVQRCKEQWIEREEAQVLLLPLLLTWGAIHHLSFSVCKMRE